MADEVRVSEENFSIRFNHWCHTIVHSCSAAECHFHSCERITSHKVDFVITENLLTKGFSPKATRTKAGTNLAIWTKAGTNFAGLVRSLSPRQPRAWCGAYLPVSLGLSAVPISS